MPRDQGLRHTDGLGRNGTGISNWPLPELRIATVPRAEGEPGFVIIPIRQRQLRPQEKSKFGTLFSSLQLREMLHCGEVLVLDDGLGAQQRIQETKS
eukprot:6177351-Pleurochrysis_carterae.AAC.2